jgi:hypothetical protein
MRDRADLRQVRALLDALVERVRAAVANGATLEATMAQARGWAEPRSFRSVARPEVACGSGEHRRSEDQKIRRNVH